MSSLEVIKEHWTDLIYLKHYQNEETNRTQYLKGLVLDYLINGYNDRNMHYLARELYYKGKYKEAIVLFKKHVENKGWKTEQGQSLIYMGDCYNRLGEEENAKKCYSLGFSYDVNRREALIGLAGIFFNNKQWKEAELIYRMCLLITVSILF